LLLQALQADRLQVWRQMTLEFPGREGLLIRDLFERGERRRPFERWPPGQTLVEDGTQGIDVGCGRYLIGGSADLLGRHVTWRPQDLALPRYGVLSLQELGQPKIGDLGDPVLGKQDVGRLQVTVDDSALMGEVHRTGERLEQA